MAGSRDTHTHTHTEPDEAGHRAVEYDLRGLLGLLTALLSCIIGMELGHIRQKHLEREWWHCLFDLTYSMYTRCTVFAFITLSSLAYQYW